MSLFSPVVVDNKVHLSVISNAAHSMRIHIVDVAVHNMDSSGYEIRQIPYECRLSSCPICERSTEGHSDPHVLTVDIDAVLALDLNDNISPVILDCSKIKNCRSLCGYEVVASPDFKSIDVVQTTGISISYWTCNELATIEDWENADSILDYSLHSLLDAKLCKYTIDSRL